MLIIIHGHDVLSYYDIIIADKRSGVNLFFFPVPDNLEAASFTTDGAI